MTVKISNFLKIIFIYFAFITNSFGELIKKIEITGNNRIADETIIVFSKIKINDELNDDSLNAILKNLYETNFFKNISLKIENETLYIKVDEEPLIQSLIIKGIKSDTIEKSIRDVSSLRDRSSFNKNILNNDRNKIKKLLRNLGYYFSEISTSVEDLEDNKINLVYDIDMGPKSKIKNIIFTGNKIFKDRKLRSVIVSEEYKFWKFISGRKYLNEEIIKLDQNLLKNFYKNEGYYNVQINSSFARLVSESEFDLIFNINANNKYYFDNIDLKMAIDYDENNFQKIYKLFENLKGEHYSISSIEKILKKIDEIIIQEQFESIKATVTENVSDNKINLLFEINETEKFFVERINILGNNVTEEKVIRNYLLIDEGDPYNEILANKSINNLKALNFFKTVESSLETSKKNTNKIINIKVEEKATGEIMAGAGVGTSGSTMLFGIKENNYLGKGIKLNTQLKISEEDIKGSFSVSNPNFRNTDKSVSLNVQSSETDKLTESGYKTNKTGFNIGTRFEFYDDFNLGIGTSNYYEKISTNSTASTRQQNQAGNYWDSFLNLSFTQDKRNRKFQSSSGYLSRYSLDLPIISDTNSFINEYSYKMFTELYDQNISSLGFSFGSAFSLDDNDVKLSERLFIPSSKLRGFESGRVGPKDGDDFIGGNYMATLNFSTTLPQILPNSQNIDTVFFIDIANLWGIDYDSSLDGESKVKSAIGLGLDWFTAIGPLNFTFSQPITKDTKDKTETFRFNIGTTF